MCGAISGVGPFETCRRTVTMSVYRVERKSSVRGQADVNDPKADIPWSPADVRFWD